MKRLASAEGHSRRAFLRAAAGIGVGGVITPAASPARDAGAFTPVSRTLTATDRFDIGEERTALIEAAYKRGYDLEKAHGGCARCTVAALLDTLPFLPDGHGAFRIAACLDGGATPTKLANCGGFTGAGIVIGWTCGEDIFGSGNGLAHRLIRQVYDRFAAAYGSVLCKDIREKAGRDCPTVVGQAARWTAEVLIEQFTT